MFHVKILKKWVEGKCKNYDVELLPCWFFKDFCTKLKLCCFANFNDGIRGLVFGGTSVEGLNGFHT